MFSHRTTDAGSVVPVMNVAKFLCAKVIAPPERLLQNPDTVLWMDGRDCGYHRTVDGEVNRGFLLGDELEFRGATTQVLPHHVRVLVRHCEVPEGAHASVCASAVVHDLDRSDARGPVRPVYPPR
jgi:hypothetical protein